MRTCMVWLLLSLIVALAGCRKKQPEPAPAKPRAEPARAEPTTKEIPDPFNLGPSPTVAKAGDFVLCPPQEWVEKAIASGEPENQTFVFYGAHMVEPGPAVSRVKSQTGKEMAIPNYLIIPVGKGETAQPGDILLTRWQTGSGMQRAIVVEGGTPARPSVRYLDIDLDNPSGFGQRAEPCEPDTFHKLGEEWEPGTSVAVKDGTRRRRWKIVHVKGEKVLGVGFAGKVKVLDKKDCAPVPVRPEVKAGATVWVPYSGSYSEGKVKKVDKAIGRVFTEIEWGGQKKSVAAPVVDVLTADPG